MRDRGQLESVHRRMTGAMEGQINPSHEKDYKNQKEEGQPENKMRYQVTQRW